MELGGKETNPDSYAPLSCICAPFPVGITSTLLLKPSDFTNAALGICSLMDEGKLYVLHNCILCGNSVGKMSVIDGHLVSLGPTGFSTLVKIV